MKRGTLVGVGVTLAFGAILVVGTLRSQRASCEVCVTFNGQTRCATASAESEREARRSAQSTACGPMTRGMDEIRQCDAVPPDRATCRVR
jgi:hypothetical protein